MDDDEAEEALINLLKSTDLPKTDAEVEKKQKNVIPKSYELYIRPFLEEDPTKNFKFDGNVSITFQVKKPVKTVILHSKDLNIIELFVTYQSKHEIKKLTSANQVEQTENDNSTLSENTIEDANMDKNTTDLYSTNDNFFSSTASPSTEAPKEEHTDKPKDEEVAESKQETTAKPVVEVSSSSSTTSTTEKPKSVTDGRRMDEAPKVKSSTPEPPGIIDAPLNTYLLKSRMWQSNNKLRIEFDEDRLLLGINYTIHIIFNGTMSDRFGLVKSDFYNEEDKNKRYVLLSCLRTSGSCGYLIVEIVCTNLIMVVFRSSMTLKLY